jgi:nitrite reductase (NO-forming)
MPNQGLSDTEIKEYLAYFKWADTNLQPKGTQQPQPAAAGTALPPSRTKSATPLPGADTGASSGTPPTAPAKAMVHK